METEATFLGEALAATASHVGRLAAGAWPGPLLQGDCSYPQVLSLPATTCKSPEASTRSPRLLFQLTREAQETQWGQLCQGQPCWGKRAGH